MVSLQYVLFFLYPRCVGSLHVMVHLRLRLLSTAEPSVTVKCLQPPSLSLQSSSAGDLTLRNGCRDCNRAIWLPFPWKKNWSQAKSKNNKITPVNEVKRSFRAFLTALCMQWIVNRLDVGCKPYLSRSWVLLGAAAERAAPDVVP